jgi:serine/threonine-protein kinase
VSRRCPQCGTEYPDDSSFCGNDGVIVIQVPPAGQIADPRLGQRFGDYVVAAHVADGAMGRVYEGRHDQTKQRVAIKVLHPDVAKDNVAVERFKREFETAQGIDSPYVVRVIDFGETPDKSYFLTMEYLQGLELGALLRRDGSIPPARSLRILAQMALGLDDAHSFGVIHRDLKPDNVFLVDTPEGDQIRILDFGSVKLQMETGPKLTAFGTTLGSPYYMSPEQAMGKADVDNRTDGLALMAIFYEMLSGKIAFEGKQVAEILMKIVNAMPVPLSQAKPGLPHALDDVIEKGLAKDKKRRYGSTIELAAAAFGAFGIQLPADRASIELWGKKSVADIETALASAKPAAATPYGAPAAAPMGASMPGSAPMAAAGPMEPMGMPTQRSPIVPIVIGLGVLGLLAIFGSAALYFFMR